MIACAARAAGGAEASPTLPRMPSSPPPVRSGQAEAAGTPPVLLALDTSTEQLAVALLAGGRTLTLAEAGGPRASARLLPAVQALLAEAGLAVSALDAVAFGRGPGAFTGLRTACAVAQGLAYGAGRPVLALDSLAIVADDARAQHGDAAAEVAVAMDARMDEVYAAVYAWDGSGWQVREAAALWPVALLAAQWHAAPPACVAGTALAAFGDRLPTGRALRVPAEQDRAAALARLAAQAWARGEAIDPALALPLYVRDKVALTTAEREARKAVS